ncbi:Phosphate regulon transcriptional regulatory protein PhoB [Shimia sp. SK013]|uniref:response regulator n=1 Tax=Shimia sp. SK013 TaxID=1389006 RepID=UPI0006B45459|nr:response regulator [Shimia sp. SK013]KPA21872.1 Phosphate regulon transcriptional regulatory protein PhoB [Shimia sp. SK013]
MGDLRKILHVEDDPDIREIAYLALAELGGFEVLQCASGMEAIEKAEAFLPDVFLLDMMMPGMTGVETIVAIRAQTSLVEVPAIFMTSKNIATEHQDEIRTLAVGAIQKPFDPVALPDQIRSMVAKSAT